jgi:hypothetical protein
MMFVCILVLLSVLVLHMRVDAESERSWLEYVRADLPELKE